MFTATLHSMQYQDISYHIFVHTHNHSCHLTFVAIGSILCLECLTHEYMTFKEGE